MRWVGDRLFAGFVPRYLSNKTITAAWQRLDELWPFGRVTEGLSESIYGSIQALVEIDERIRGPQSLLQFIPRDQLPGMLQQNVENLKRLSLKRPSVAVAAELCGFEVESELAEANLAVGFGGKNHRDAPSSVAEEFSIECHQSRSNAETAS